MPRESLVGNDHGGSHHYLDAELWFNAESSIDYSLPIVALCKGDFGSNFTLSGTSVNGAEIKSLDAIYNGSNDVGLAVCKSMNLQAVIDIHDVAILPTSAFFAALSMNANSDGSTLYNLYVEHLTANGVDVVVVAGNCPNSLLRNSVLNGGVNGIDYGYNYKLNVEHLTVSNASNIGLKGSLSVSTATNCFSLNNTNGDHSDIVKVNCASSDATGNPGLTGYTDTELVNLAGKDFRTKASSPLATAGTNGTYIGAFLEAITSNSLITDIDCRNLIYDSLVSDVDLRGKILGVSLSDTDLRTKIYNGEISNLDVRNSLLGSAFSDVDLRNKIFNVAYADVDIRNEILAQAQSSSVITDLDIRNSLSNAALADLIIQSKILQATLVDVDFRNQVLQAITRDIDISNKVYQFTTSDTDIRNKVYGFVYSDLTIRNSVDGVRSSESVIEKFTFSFHQDSFAIDSSQNNSFKITEHTQNFTLRN